ncbi:unnamed protein product [Acanthoscelides obtectus]|uniref:UDP-glucuronosyltransferase n=1 Tax=Acanthoscelides obtectus TaxID=200917 RepID=A0A9P0KPD1_ACAOB|nr:unnamed protein product [Acanthoscelides obtectus]CAK1665201.1 UDP-glucuronosyltransferase 2B7 [Acanthoscelides obtectus]
MRFLKNTQIIFIFLLLIGKHDGAKILGLFPNFGYSQFILGDALLSELARKGHEITVISAFKPKESLPNYRTVLLDLPQSECNFFEPSSSNLFGEVIGFNQLFLDVSETVLSNAVFQEFIRRSNETFDLAIVELFGSESQLAVARHFNCPLIGLSSQGLSEWNSHLLGNVRLPSLTCWSNAPFSSKMSFFERLYHTLISFFDLAYKYFVYFPEHQRLIRKYYPGNHQLDDVVESVDLVLLNSHYSATEPSMLTTAAVEIGGFHIKPKKLPDDIQKFLDGAKDGAILFSLGTNAKSKHLPKDRVKGIVRAIGRLKQRVLWKYEDEDIQIPDNLMITKWVPQPDVLAHPNIVAFISHGGLLSGTEALYFGVPIIGIPVFADQPRNVRVWVEKGTTIHLPLKELGESSLYSAVEEIIKNPSYKNSAKRYSELLKDRPVQPMDLAVYWVEHILRHKGGKHLRNTSKDLYWFQLYSVDILIFIFICVYLLYYIIKSVFKLTFKKNCSKVKVN